MEGFTAGHYGPTDDIREENYGFCQVYFDGNEPETKGLYFRAQRLNWRAEEIKINTNLEGERLEYCLQWARQFLGLEKVIFS